MLKFSFSGNGIVSGVSYHNHSNMSDGGASPEEMCRAGKAAGLREFGLSDHWVIHPESDAAPTWRMDPNRLDEYVSRMQALKQELDSENFILRIGLEVDFFFENAEDVLAQLRQYPFDYLIGAVHFSGRFVVDDGTEAWLTLDEAERRAVRETYWEKELGAAQCKDFTFLAHLDLPKKYGMMQSEAYFPHALKVLDALRQKGGALELNTAGWSMPCAEQYPAEKVLSAARQRAIPVVISADAHVPANVTRNFEKAQETLARCGYSTDGR